MKHEGEGKNGAEKFGRDWIDGIGRNWWEKKKYEEGAIKSVNSSHMNSQVGRMHN